MKKRKKEEEKTLSFYTAATAFFTAPPPPLPPFPCAMSQLYTLEMLTCVVVMQSRTKSRSSPLDLIFLLAAASLASSRA